MVAAASLAAPAGAATVVGTERGETLRGTPRADVIDGRGGADRVRAGAGADRIHAWDGRRDDVGCGAGDDVVVADRSDRVAADCETVSRALSSDPFRGSESQHETQVEPHGTAWGSTIVSAFQSGRFEDGAAEGIGFATSADAGRSWSRGVLPSLTAASRPAGRAARASDPAVAYDGVHGVWLILSLTTSADTTELVVSRSGDGRRWEAPTIVRSEPSGRAGVSLDKGWIVCDTGTSSPLRGSCYVAYSDLSGRSDRLVVQASRDGGLTWTAPVAPPGAEGAFGPQPVVRPGGDLVVVYIAAGRAPGLRAVRSVDGGATFFGPVPASPAIRTARTLRVRAPLTPSAAVDAAGTVWVAFAGCVGSSPCAENRLLLVRSDDGASWSRPSRVPVPAAAGRFVVGLGTAAGGQTLGLTYYELAAGKLNARFVGSVDGARTWSRARLLSALPIEPDWLADTRLGRMVGDYVATPFAGASPVPIVAMAGPKHGSSFREAIFAAELR